MDKAQKLASNTLRTRHNTVVRLTKYVQEVDKETDSYLARRKAVEERLVKRMMDERVDLQRQTILELRKHRREDLKKEVQDQLNRAEAQRQSLRDQVAMMQEQVRTARDDELLREKNWKEVHRNGGFCVV